MGAEGFYVDKVEDIQPTFEKAFEISMTKPVVVEARVDGTKLAPPFRKDALALPTRFLPRYEHLDAKHFAK